MNESSLNSHTMFANAPHSVPRVRELDSPVDHLMLLGVLSSYFYSKADLVLNTLNLTRY